MKKETHYISAEHLTIDRVEQIIECGMSLALSDDARDRINRCRAYLDEKMISQTEPIYGITTGFGSLCDISIDRKQLSQLHSW